MHRFAAAVLIGLSVAACAAGDRQSVSESSAILPQEIRASLRSGEGEFAPDQVYITPRAERQRYGKILLDPLLYFAPLDQMRRVSSGDRQVLLNNFYILLSRELSKDYTLVRTPQAGAARVQFAVLPVTQDAVALDTVSMVAPEDGEVVQDLLASPVIVRGDINVESEWTDSVTGAVLGATLDRHFGRQSIDVSRIKSWADVNRILEDYAILVRYRLCEFRAGQNCSAPPDSLR